MQFLSHISPMWLVATMSDSANCRLFPSSQKGRLDNVVLENIRLIHNDKKTGK